MSGLGLAILLTFNGATVSSPASSGPIAPGTKVHVSLMLSLTHREELRQLLRDQQDPRSPQYRQWLTPAQFGERFGQPGEVYGALLGWLKSGGLEVTDSPSRRIVQALGTAAQIQKLLGVTLLGLEDFPASVHVPDRAPTFPAALAGAVRNVSGLDTRFRFHHHFRDSQGDPSIGPQDLRRLYDLLPILDAGFVAQGQQTVVLSTALPEGSQVSLPDVQYFLSSISDSVTPLNVVTLPNPQDDVEPIAGGNLEFELDLEMQSVGNIAGQSLTLLVSPASEVFTAGAAYIVDSLPTATSVSVSLGNCEQVELDDDPNEPSSMQDTVMQGLAEGQTWSAAAGDSGADDCQAGVLATPAAAVDFPASIPEFVALGGSQIAAPVWDANLALPSYQPEQVWNGGVNGGAGGGGISELFLAPSYQLGLWQAQGLTGADAGRLVPDLALIAGSPGVVEDSSTPGVLDVVGGTSIASPLSAGFFALIASRLGCRLGDVHPVLYQLGAAQLDGGPVVFHDITSGDNSYDGVTGYSAGVGYDLASGWGSVDLAALAAAWPGCPDAGPDAGFALPFDAGPSYDPCGFLACDGGAQCLTLSGGEGPSACVIGCDAQDAGSCALGSICTGTSLYASADAGQCVPGCLSSAACDAGEVCSLCLETCVAAGNDTAHVGDGCVTDSDCPSGGLCETGRFDGGYCTFACDTGVATTAVCGCPSGSFCDAVGSGGAEMCVERCDDPQGFCARGGYLCQPGDAGSACLPPCRVTSRGDTCLIRYGSTLACEPDSGICGGPLLDAGVVEDAGTTADAGLDAGTPLQVDAGVDAGANASTSGGCSCTSGSGAGAKATDEGLWLGLLMFYGAIARRRAGLRAAKGER